MLKLRDWIDLDKINWEHISANPNAIHLLEQNIDKIYWTYLSCNLSAIHLLEKNRDKINLFYLSKNSNAIHLLEQNLDKINWLHLSGNPNAIHLLENNLNKVNWLLRNPCVWYALSENPSIFEYDYKSMKNNNKELKEELIQTIYHPHNYDKWKYY